MCAFVKRWVEAACCFSWTFMFQAYVLFGKDLVDGLLFAALVEEPHGHIPNAYRQCSATPAQGLEQKCYTYSSCPILPALVCTKPWSCPLQRITFSVGCCKNLIKLLVSSGDCRSALCSAPYKPARSFPSTNGTTWIAHPVATMCGQHIFLLII